mgnify:CR=1 FL=1
MTHYKKAEPSDVAVIAVIVVGAIIVIIGVLSAVTVFLLKRYLLTYVFQTLTFFYSEYFCY